MALAKNTKSAAVHLVKKNKKQARRLKFSIIGLLLYNVKNKKGFFIVKTKSKILSVIMAILLIAVTITGSATTALAADNPSPTSVTTIYGRPVLLRLTGKRLKCNRLSGEICYLKQFRQCCGNQCQQYKSNINNKKQSRKQKVLCQMRTYKKVNNKNYYSAWTKAYNITTRNKNEPYSTYVQTVKSDLGSFTAS